MIRRFKFIVAVAVLLGMQNSVWAYWQRLLSDDFSGASSTGSWIYAGVSNSVGEALIRYDAHGQNIAAEWDQSNLYRGWPNDPEIIVASSFSRPLDRTLTDQDTFRFGAVVQLTAGSIPDTTEFYEIANFGLYNLAEMGPDRFLSDNYSGNSNLVKDAGDFVEFNYFINNDSYGFNPSIQPTIGPHLTGAGELYCVGGNGDALWHDTDMGKDHWLPEGTNLYIEVVYYGAETNLYARRAYGAIYTEPERTNLLIVNGVGMYYWTKPLPDDQSFSVKEFAFFNYAGANWGGLNGVGAGSFDDVYADRFIPETAIFSNSVQSGQMVATWAAVTGKTYFVEYCTNLAANLWVTNAVVQADGETVTITNTADGKRGYYRVSY